MRSAPTYEVRLDLTGIGDLFRAPDIDPFDPRYADHSGQPALEFIADEIYANGSYRAAKATFVIPDAPSHDIDEIHAAVRRWSSARAGSHRQDVSAMRWRGVRSLMSGLVLFALFFLTAQVVDGDGDGLASALAEGLEVAAWVVLWFPIETLIWSVWQHRLDRRSFDVVRDMEVRLAASTES